MFAERVLLLRNRGTRPESQLLFTEQLQLYPVQDTNINANIG